MEKYVVSDLVFVGLVGVALGFCRDHLLQRDSHQVGVEVWTHAHYAREEPAPIFLQQALVDDQPENLVDCSVRRSADEDLLRV